VGSARAKPHLCARWRTRRRVTTKPFTWNPSNPRPGGVGPVAGAAAVLRLIPGCKSGPTQTRPVKTSRRTQYPEPRRPRMCPLLRRAFPLTLALLALAGLTALFLNAFPQPLPPSPAVLPDPASLDRDLRALHEEHAHKIEAFLASNRDLP